MFPRQFSDLSEMLADSEVPPLDRASVLGLLLSAEQRLWHQDGLVVVNDAVPAADLAAYERWRTETKLPIQFRAIPLSYRYQFVPELRKIALSKKVHGIMSSLPREPMIAPFDLTQWVSTERTWHQDDYLNDESGHLSHQVS